MPKGTNQKFKLYRLAQIMLERTDDDHYITMPEIMVGTTQGIIMMLRRKREPRILLSRMTARIKPIKNWEITTANTNTKVVMIAGISLSFWNSLM